MKICDNCGTPLTSGANQCQICSVGLAEDVKNPPNPEQISFDCASCGHPVAIGISICPFCGGYPFDDEAPPPVPGLPSIREDSRPLEADTVDLDEGCRCPSCGDRMTAGKSFCSNCGAPLDSKEAKAPSQEEPETHACPECERPLPETAKFCIHCGHHLKVIPTSPGTVPRPPEIPARPAKIAGTPSAPPIAKVDEAPIPKSEDRPIPAAPPIPGTPKVSGPAVTPPTATLPIFDSKTENEDYDHILESLLTGAGLKAEIEQEKESPEVPAVNVGSETEVEAESEMDLEPGVEPESGEETTPELEPAISEDLTPETGSKPTIEEEEEEEEESEVAPEAREETTPELEPAILEDLTPETGAKPTVEEEEEEGEVKPEFAEEPAIEEEPEPKVKTALEPERATVKPKPKVETELESELEEETAQDFVTEPPLSKEPDPEAAAAAAEEEEEEAKGQALVSEPEQELGPKIGPSLETKPEPRREREAETEKGKPGPSAEEPVPAKEPQSSSRPWMPIGIGLAALVILALGVAWLMGWLGAASGTLAVTTEVGVEILVNGETAGISPIGPLNLPTGKHQIEYRLAGQSLGSEEILIQDSRTTQNERQSLLHRLQFESPAELRGELEVDGTPISNWSAGILLPPGDHVVTFRTEGIEAITRQVRAESGGESTLTFAPSPESSSQPSSTSGTLTVESEVTAEIFEGGNRLGTTPTQLSLSPGTHRLSYRYQGLERTVSHRIEPGKTLRHIVVFERSVRINARPWANVALRTSDGGNRNLGQTPIANLEIPIGATLIFTHPQHGTKTHRVKAGDESIVIEFP